MLLVGWFPGRPTHRRRDKDPYREFQSLVLDSMRVLCRCFLAFLAAQLQQMSHQICCSLKFRLARGSHFRSKARARKLVLVIRELVPVSWIRPKWCRTPKIWVLLLVSPTQAHREYISKSNKRAYFIVLQQSWRSSLTTHFVVVEIVIAARCLQALLWQELGGGDLSLRINLDVSSKWIK